MGWKDATLTHRQYLAWGAWFDGEWHRPSLSDHYSMQIAQEVRRVLSRKPNSIKLEHFKLQFERPTEKTEEDEQRQLEIDKSVWAFRLSAAHSRSVLREKKRL